METIIRIVAAIILDADGRVLLVRKKNTDAYMQPGGKPLSREAPLLALKREIKEELGAEFNVKRARFAGHFTVPAANEPGLIVDAELYYIDLLSAPVPQGGIEDMIWLSHDQTSQFSLAPLTENCVLPLIFDGPRD